MKMSQTNPEMTPKVSIVIVNWNGAQYLPRCLEAVYAQTFRDYEVIVVDNASTDASVVGLEERWPGVQVVRLDENIGFAPANNLGARLACGDWLALLNNDAFPAPGWLETILQAASTSPQFSFFSSCIIQATDNDRIDGTGDVYHASGLAWHRDYNQPAARAHKAPGEVFSPCAAAAVYNRQQFLELGGFNEDFVSHHEDVDLGFRLRLQGFRCLYVPQAIVEHIGSASYGRESDRTIYSVHRNLVWSYFINMPGSLVWRYLPSHLAATLIFVIYYSLRGQARPIWKAKLDALRGLPSALRRRRVIQKRRKIPPDEIRKIIDRSWISPYILGRNSDKIQRVMRALKLDRR
jgi:GT2 family glycosyltransferase